MLQAGKLLRENENDENSPFEDYSIYMYRQSAPEFKDRVKDLEQKIAVVLFPVRMNKSKMICCDNFCLRFFCSFFPLLYGLLSPFKIPNCQLNELESIYEISHATLLK